MNRTPARRGFTLIELLVVVALLAVLAAIGVAAAFRIKTAQQKGATEATETKIQTNLDKRWKAVIDAAAEDASNNRIPPAVMAYAGNDKDRARSVWTYFKLKNEFPTTVAEAVTDIQVGNVVVLAHRTVFNQLTASGTAEEQSAACIYVALTATGNRGEVMGTDGTEQQAGEIALTGGGTARVFKDTFGQPIAFVRMGFDPEVDNPPYFRQSPGVNSKDPCDPLGKLQMPSATAPAAWSTSGANNTLTDFWTRVAQNHIGSTQQPSANYTLPATYPARNWVPTVVSAGPNGNKNGFDGYLFGGDNIVSYRLRRAGQRGD